VITNTAHVTELCLQLTAGSRPANRDEHRALGSQSCERALSTMERVIYLINPTWLLEGRNASIRPKKILVPLAAVWQKK